MQNYKVLVLGASGAGKTFLLASMFKQLSIQKDEFGFYLDAEDIQRKKLLNLFAEIANPDLEWPPGTTRADVSKWQFTCAVKSNNGISFPLFKFTYLDYAGELLTHNIPDSEAVTPNFQVEQEAEKADALLILIDGQKTLFMMQGDRNARSRLEHELSHILPIVQNVKFMPIHFVVTKWDLFINKFTLKEVRDSLSQIGEFKGIIQQRKGLSIPTRLIPVSALGNGFAKIDPESGWMVKETSSNWPSPINVEMPLVCVLVDKFHTAKKQLESDATSIEFLWKKFRLQILLLFYPLISRIADSRKIIIGVLFEILDKKINEKERLLKIEEEQNQVNFENYSSALRSVIENHGALQNQLETEYPESNLLLLDLER